MSLINVYYGGSEAEWNNIEIRSGNQDLLNATIHYNCEEETAEIKSVSPVSSSNGVYKFKIEFDNINQSGVLVAALYKKGVMQGYKTVNILPGVTSSTITVTAGAADSARFFVWDSLGTMKPLCEAKSINI